MKYLNKIIEYGLYLLVFLLPWQTRWIIKAGEMEYATYSLYGADILLVALILLFVFFKCRMNFNNKEPSSGLPSVWYFIGLLDLFVFISIFFATDKWLAFYKYGWFLLGTGLFWLITSASYNKMKLFWSLLAGIFLQAGLGIYQFLSQSSFASKWLGIVMHNPAELGASVVEIFGADGIGERWLRAYGGLDHPNMLGGAVAIGLLLIISLIVPKSLPRRLASRRSGQADKCQNPPTYAKATAGKNAKSNPNTKIQNIFLFLPARLCLAVAGGCFFVFVMSLFFTFSRGAWAGLLIGVLLMLFIFLIKKDFLKQRELLKIILASGVLIFVLSNLYSGLVLTRLSKDTRLEIKSNTERIESFTDAKELLKDNWLFGVGIGNYTLALREMKSDQPIWDYQPVHNVFLLVWAEVGILGLLGFLGFLGFLGWNLIKKGKYFGLSILTALVIMMMVDHWYWSLHFGVLWFWLVCGLILTDTDSGGLTRTNTD